MKWAYFVGGFCFSFLPFLFPNGAIVFFSPMVIFAYPSIFLLGVVLNAPFIFAVVQAVRGKKGAYAWIFGSIVSVSVGFILFVSIGFNFIPV